jgi:hypothetical protein
MKKIFLTLAASLAIFASCDEHNNIQDPEQSQVPDQEQVETEKDVLTPISLKIGNPATRSSEASSYEQDINTLQIMVFTQDVNGAEMYDSYYTFGSESEDYVIYIDPNRTDVSKYRFAAYVNQPELNDQTYMKDWALLSNEKTTSFQMYGESTYTADKLKTEKTANIIVSRQCSRIEVHEIAVDWTNSVNARKEFKLKGIYLMDVPGVSENHYDVDLSVSENKNLWVNRNRYTPSNLDNLLYDRISDIEVKETDSYKNSHYLYGYISGLTVYNEGEDWNNDNWQPSGTRLVIEAEFDGSPCYYAIKLNELNTDKASVKNKIFIFTKITITKPGSEHPYSPLGTENPVTVSVTVDDWKPGFEGNYTVQ